MARLMSMRQFCAAANISKTAVHKHRINKVIHPMKVDYFWIFTGKDLKLLTTHRKERLLRIESRKKNQTIGRRRLTKLRTLYRDPGALRFLCFDISLKGSLEYELEWGREGYSKSEIEAFLKYLNSLPWL